MWVICLSLCESGNFSFSNIKLFDIMDDMSFCFIFSELKGFKSERRNLNLNL